ncbi:hypothetical protein [Limosilactobacillus reuteri]|nr:hypothetical protein [Limosilactobacillus reuteri]
MSFRAHIFFKNNPIGQPLDVANIFKITVGQNEIQPSKLSIDGLETIALHCSGNSFNDKTRHSTMVLKSSELLAIEFIEEIND